jgi:proteasome lid subunit RPN8/RPN11
LSIEIPSHILHDLHAHVQAAYPGEGAGFLLGSEQNGRRLVSALLTLPNAREVEARYNRFLLTAEDYLKGELEAERLDLTLLGVFHSHPDCPNRPSEYDREWAMPWFSYIITRVDGDGRAGQAVSDLSWRLQDDRTAYTSEEIKES